MDPCVRHSFATLPAIFLHVRDAQASFASIKQRFQPLLPLAWISPTSEPITTAGWWTCCSLSVELLLIPDFRSIRSILASLRKMIVAKWPNVEDHATALYVGPSAFVFLRFICPALLTPKQFNVTTGTTSPNPHHLEIHEVVTKVITVIIPVVNLLALRELATLVTTHTPRFLFVTWPSSQPLPRTNLMFRALPDLPSKHGSHHQSPSRSCKSCCLWTKRTLYDFC